jgi:predicted nucleic acid-binding protein
MILLDTTVLVGYLRNPSATVRAVLESGQVAVCGVTRAELLHGARTPKDAAALVAAMDCFVQIPISQSDWDQLGYNLALLRSSGVSVPFPDALIATIAIRDGSDLWTYDAHFQAIGAVLTGLRLFDGPAA